MRRTGPSAQTSATATHSGAIRRARCDHVSRASSRHRTSSGSPRYAPSSARFPRKRSGDRVQEIAAYQREPRRDHEVREIGREDERRVDASRLEPGERRHEQRRHEQRCEQRRSRQRPDESPQRGIERRAQAEPRHAERQRPGDDRGQRELGRERQQQRGQQPARHDEAPIADLAPEVAQRSAAPAAGSGTPARRAGDRATVRAGSSRSRTPSRRPATARSGRRARVRAGTHRRPPGQGRPRSRRRRPRQGRTRPSAATRGARHPEPKSPMQGSRRREPRWRA